MAGKNYLRYALTLGILILVAPGFLSVFFNLMQPEIASQDARQESKNLKEVFPSAVRFEGVQERGAVAYYKALGPRKNVLGYCFLVSRRGYTSDIVTLAGMDTQGVITRIKILSQNETPGLGTRITEVTGKNTVPWFQEKFSGKRADALKNSVDAITGATISSMAVIEGVQEKAREIEQKVKNGR